MNFNTSVYLNGVGLVCASGQSPEVLLDSIHAGRTNVQQRSTELWPELPLGAVQSVLPDVSSFQNTNHVTRNNALALASLLQIDHLVREAIQQYGRDRIAVIIGTSTSGIAETESVFKLRAAGQKAHHFYPMQEMSAPAEFIADYYKLSGIRYGISTACTSGSKALVTARGLIRAGLCDAVIAGGVDTLCELTVQGFSSLGAVSRQLCQPFSAQRDGINIGEASALFLMSKQPGEIALVGAGASSDAHHISAPDPSGQGAISAMQAALTDAGLTPGDIQYINAHGTATELNDSMEAEAIFHIFQDKVAVSSTKPFTGHTLGAAGALEAAICWQVLQSGQEFMPQQLGCITPDPRIKPIQLVHSQQKHDSTLKYLMSNSFAFGGNNLSIILGKSF